MCVYKSVEDDYVWTCVEDGAVLNIVVEDDYRLKTMFVRMTLFRSYCV